MKPYVKLASGLVLGGMGLFTLERYGLGRTNPEGLHLAGWVVSTMVLVPLALIAAGCVTFVVGRIRRL
jgi:hypothetical protein